MTDHGQAKERHRGIWLHEKDLQRTRRRDCNFAEATEGAGQEREILACRGPKTPSTTNCGFRNQMVCVF